MLVDIEPSLVYISSFHSADMMFEISADDIYALSDTDLRALVALLCEATVRERGFSTKGVTYGGKQTAKDGGLDVKVTLPGKEKIGGFLPRLLCGFQVKKPDLRPAAITKEMRPNGKLRTIFKDLAAKKGAYIIASSGADLTDSALENRLAAMAAAIKKLKGGEQIQLEFYDRTRLATWVRNHGGMILWVRQRIGRSVQNWHPYSAWAYAPDGVGGAYLLDDRHRVKTGEKKDSDGLSAIEGLIRLRDLLREPGKVARIVGLSGVGKTRFVQALFDDRVGEKALEPTLAIYCNFADDPSPAPIAMATDLIVSKTKAILIVDNCPPDLHRRLTDVCRQNGSTVNAVTVEYDIRDDNPEGTEVFTLTPSSNDLIEKLVRKRFTDISRVDAQTIASFSGGNARIAIALASTLKKGDTLAGMSDEDLFKRLFQQRHHHNDDLMKTAKAASLVYSFDGEDVSKGAKAELFRLGRCVQQAPNWVFQNIAELQRRELVQQRSKWRAVLPHAIANRLAVLALQDIPYSVIGAQLAGEGAPERLMRSFSRRLGYLHHSREAVDIVTRWLSPGGLLADLAQHDSLKRTMFENVLPVVPDIGLKFLERAAVNAPEDKPHPLADYVRRILSLAWEAKDFERCATLLIEIAKRDEPRAFHSGSSDAFKSLFPLYLSGTHATVEQRCAFAEKLLKSAHEKERELGDLALHGLIEAWHFSSFYDAEFGARSRDNGYWPKTTAEVVHWYTKTLDLAVRTGNSTLPSAEYARAQLGSHFRGLWNSRYLRPLMEKTTKALNAHAYWREGWIGIRQTLKFDLKKGTPEYRQLAKLENLLRPEGLVQRVRAMLLTGRTYDFEGDDDLADASGKKPDRATIAFTLGSEVAADKNVYATLLPELVRSKGYLADFGRGLVASADSPRIYWNDLTKAYAKTPNVERSEFVLRGVIAGIAAEDRKLANDILDDLVKDAELVHVLPIMQMMIGVDKVGVERLQRTIRSGSAPIGAFSYLSFGGCTRNTLPKDLAKLIMDIARAKDGLNVAVDIIHMRIYGDRADKKNVAGEIKAAGRQVLGLLSFESERYSEDHALSEIVKYCLNGAAGSTVAKQVSLRFREAIKGHKILGSNYSNFIRALAKSHPTIVLDSLLGDFDPNERKRMLDLLRIHEVDLFSDIQEKVLLDWCAKEPAERYTAAASALRVVESSDGETAKQWTPLALSLLEAAPDPEPVISILLDKIYPRSWSGSFASTLEKNMQILEVLVAHSNKVISAGALKAKERFSKIVFDARASEQAEARAEERFE